MLDVQPGQARPLAEVQRLEPLPEKLFVFHQLSKPIVRGENSLTTHPGVATAELVIYE